MSNHLKWLFYNRSNIKGRIESRVRPKYLENLSLQNSLIIILIREHKKLCHRSPTLRRPLNRSFMLLFFDKTSWASVTQSEVWEAWLCVRGCACRWIPGLRTSWVWRCFLAWSGETISFSFSGSSLNAHYGPLGPWAAPSPLSWLPRSMLSSTLVLDCALIKYLKFLLEASSSGGGAGMRRHAFLWAPKLPGGPSPPPNCILVAKTLSLTL